MHLEVTANGNQQEQEVHSFGASDAWCTARVGVWEKQHREEVARLLFSRVLDEGGKPTGIGLSCWRVLAGAGSTECSQDWRSSDTFLRDDWNVNGIGDDRSYDFTRCPGQRWFVHAAFRYSVPHFILFAHSPPYALTANGLTHNSSSACNLQGPGGLRTREFAVYLCKIIGHFRKLGLQFSAVNPVHEPHWGSDGSSVEACSYTNDEVGRVAHALDTELTRRGMDIKVGVPDAGSLDYLTEAIPSAPNVSDFVRAYFGSGNLSPPALLSLITGHSYFSCWPQDDRLIESRERLAEVMRPAIEKGAQYWMTEYCLYIPVDEPFVPRQLARSLARGGRDDGVLDPYSLDAALWCARVIHADLAVANASAWHWWLALSPYGIPDGLIHFGLNTGEYTVTKTLWVLGHWSLFVRPGMHRIRVSRSDDKAERELLDDVLVTAFKDDAKVVFVVVNLGYTATDVQLGIANCGDVLVGATWLTVYLTSRDCNLHPVSSYPLGSSVRVPPRAVMTCVADLIKEGSSFYVVAAADDLGTPLALEVSQASPARCAIVGLGRLLGHSHQLWRFNKVTADGAYMMLVACHSAHVLEVVSESTTPKSPVHQNKATGSEAQCWTVERKVNGCAHLVVKHSRHVLEAYGSTVRVTIRSGKSDQLWFLVPAGTDLSTLPYNPAANLAKSAASGAAAWAGEWVEDAPAPSARVPRIQKPGPRYPSTQASDRLPPSAVRRLLDREEPTAEDREAQPPTTPADPPKRHGRQRGSGKRDSSGGGGGGWFTKPGDESAAAAPLAPKHSQDSLLLLAESQKPAGKKPTSSRSSTKSLGRPPTGPDRSESNASTEKAKSGTGKQPVCYVEMLLAMRAQDADDKFKRDFCATVARALELPAGNVRVTFSAHGTSKVEAELELVGIEKNSPKLDVLIEEASKEAVVSHDSLASSSSPSEDGDHDTRRRRTRQLASRDRMR
ncbi:hypothetical protein DIPPA_16435 [Diplonema papillatum]|nr:hypothetical protein DIPPA_16435 [Diplonema papillatum]